MTDGIWPGAREVASCELSRWMHPHIRHPPRRERASALLVDLVAWYVARDCLFLASALARSSTPQGRIVRFDRIGAGGGPDLGHATLVLGADGGMLSGTALDVMGRRPVQEMAAGLRRLGDLVPSVTPPIAADAFGPHAERVALAIGGCLPWMRDHVPASFRVSDADAFGCLSWIATGWEPLREGVPTDARWVESLPALPSGRGAAQTEQPMPW
jgi:hypothetical protein